MVIQEYLQKTVQTNLQLQELPALKQTPSAREGQLQTEMSLITPFVVTSYFLK